MAKSYFHQAKLKSGEYVNVVYESEHRRGTTQHGLDMYIQARGKADIDWGYRFNHDTASFSYLMTKKNMMEECFDEYRTIDVRNK